MFNIFLAVTITAYLVVATSFSGHLTSECITLYAHRCLTHSAVTYRSWLKNTMRFWLWWHAGINCRHWVAVHRYHHSTSDTPLDPHTPTTLGVFCAPPLAHAKRPLWPLRLICPQGWGLFWKNFNQYRLASHNERIINKYGTIPIDWLEKHFFSRYLRWGPFILLPFTHVFFSGLLLYALGLNVWWALLVGPLTASSILTWIVLTQSFVNSFGHSATERSPRTNDFSRDLYGSGWKNFVLNFFEAGEQIHHGHHSNQKNWDFGPHDFGATVIKLLVKLRLARVKIMPIKNPRPI
ncbi:MAG: fatty acid desaturase [Candidatus Veblenbacteria bacterium]|nr:fatty acid desaturase [Candidatus Veblenbacteria bacterium]